MIRCEWCGSDPRYIAYRDDEWGVPVHDDRRLFEMLILEAAQAGLSWLTILRKRGQYRRAFQGFAVERMAAYSAADVLDSGLRIQMGDGMHCRPKMQGFPVGSEWLLALNGPGAKPGNGLALSHCGAYWVRVLGDDAVGNLEGARGEQKRMPLSELRLRLRYPRSNQVLKGRVKAGKGFQQAFGPGFLFVLEPRAGGWEIVVREQGREENLARLTPPLPFAPNPREIEGWQLVDASSPGPRPYGAESGPENPRTLIFSPEVGRRIDGPKANRSVTPEKVAAIGRFGRGTFTIKRFSLRPKSNGCARIQWLEFFAQLEWGI
jgi:hypothetical protein